MKVVNLLELSSMRKMRPKPSSRVQLTVNSIMGDATAVWEFKIEEEFCKAS